MEDRRAVPSFARSLKDSTHLVVFVEDLNGGPDAGLPEVPLGARVEPAEEHQEAGDVHVVVVVEVTEPPGTNGAIKEH